MQIPGYAPGHFHLKIFTQPFDCHCTGSFLSLFIAHIFECKFKAQNIQQAILSDGLLNLGSANRLNNTTD